MNNSFYFDLEKKFRGSRELIKKRLEIYLPLVNMLKGMFAEELNAVDFGCGRGEWLEILESVGFTAEGVDLDKKTLEYCRSRGFTVRENDANALIKELPSDYYVIVSAFHFVEHISFEELLDFIQEALRILKSGGVLILETPNPENLIVASANFYLDPTHIKPLPPNLLSFLPEYFGFRRTTIYRLNSYLDTADPSDTAFFDVLAGVSPDYAVVAQKLGAADLMAATNEAFSVRHGITLHDLASSYDIRQRSTVESIRAQLDKNSESLRQQINTVSVRDNERLELLFSAHHHLSSVVVQNRSELTSILTRIESKQQQLSASIALVELKYQELFDICNRTVWDKFKALAVSTPAALRKFVRAVLLAPVRPVVVTCIRFVQSRPRLKDFFLDRLFDYPWLEVRLRRFAIARGMGVAPYMPLGAGPIVAKRKGLGAVILTASDLSAERPNAQRFYTKLSHAIDGKRRKP